VFEFRSRNASIQLQLPQKPLIHKGKTSHSDKAPKRIYIDVAAATGSSYGVWIVSRGDS